MTRSIGAEVGLLALAVLVLSFTVALGVILATPPPQRPLMNAALAAAALRSPPADSPLLSVATQSSPPPGRNDRLLAGAVARALDVPTERVKAMWIDPQDLVRLGAHPGGQSVMIVAGFEVVVQGRPGGFELQTPEQGQLSPLTAVPAFMAAVREQDGRWRVARPRGSLIDSWRLGILLSFAAAAIVIGPLAWAVANNLTQPVRALAAHAQRISHSLDSQAPAEFGPREARIAIAALNAMQIQLRRQSEERLRMFAAIAHDLRTPLTAIRIRANAAPDRDRQRMIADLDRMERLIANVLAFASVAKTSETTERVPLHTLILEIAEDSLDRGDNVTLTAPLPPVTIAANEQSLRRAIGNLVENALRYAGNARLAVETAGDWVIISVSDDGPGIADNDIARVMRPFERLEGSRNEATGGVGLGLSIASEIARTHGGELRLENKSPASGLIASLRLPTTSSQA